MRQLLSALPFSPSGKGARAMKDKTVCHGCVTQAYAENAIRITKQIDIEQKQCGFGAQ